MLERERERILCWLIFDLIWIILIRDYWHFQDDVVSGLLLGTAMAWMSFSYFSTRTILKISRDESLQSLLPTKREIGRGDDDNLISQEDEEGDIDDVELGNIETRLLMNEEVNWAKV